MAGLISRFVVARTLRRTLLQKPRPLLVPVLRGIATTEKKKDAAVSGLHFPDDCVTTKVGGAVDTNYEKRKDWLSRGADFDDEDIDTWQFNGIMLVMITGLTVGVVWVFTYIPNPCFPDKDWVTREAFLELHRREKFGLPLIDPDIVPRENIVLPSEEELEGFEIII